MNKKFIRKVEDFTCEFCNTLVRGDGYTNHCPQCLYSKHVDVFPGDRGETCLGLMEPLEVRVKGKEYQVLHCCKICGKEKLNTLGPRDNFDEAIRIAKRVEARYLKKSGYLL